MANITNVHDFGYAVKVFTNSKDVAGAFSLALDYFAVSGAGRSFEFVAAFQHGAQNGAVVVGYAVEFRTSNLIAVA